MTINWQDLLTVVGGGTGISFAVAFLMKSVINHGLTRDIEAFKARLKADTDVEIENLRHSLQKIAYEHQVRFSKLHADRAQVIADIYTQMVEAEQYGQQFVYVEGHAEKSKRQEAYFETHRKLVEFYFFVEKRRIYLPEHICALLNTFMEKLRKSVIAINIYVPIEQPYNPQLLEEKVRVVKEVYEAFDGSIPAARRALEKEFRQILGAEQDTKDDSGTTRTETPSSLTP
jgi:hypothetical protein